MDGNVFLLDYRYLNKVILAPNRLFSDYGELSNESESYGIQIVEEQNSDEDEHIVSGVQISGVDSSGRFLHSIVENQSHVFVPCLEDGEIVMNPMSESCIDSLIGCETFVADVKNENNVESCIDSLIGCETFVADVKIENNVEVCEQIQNTDEIECSDTTQEESVPPELVKIRPNILSKIDKSFSLRKSRLMLSTCYRNNNNKSKYCHGISDETYSIYTGTKSLRCNGKTDNIIMIPPNLFKRQLMDVSDTTKPMLKMPSTRQGMKVLECSVSKVFSQPFIGQSPRLSRLFMRNCVTTSQVNNIDTDELGLLPVGYQQPIDRSKIKRITRRRKNPDAKQFQLQKMLQLSSGTDHNTRIFSGNIPSEYLKIDGPTVEWVTADDGCYFLTSEYDETGEDSQQIIIIHDEQEPPEDSTRSKNNIEVLLAAAAERQISPEELFFCQESSEMEDYKDHETIIPSEGQIILVTDSDCEELMPES